MPYPNQTKKCVFSSFGQQPTLAPKIYLQETDAYHIWFSFLVIKIWGKSGLLTNFGVESVKNDHFSQKHQMWSYIMYPCSLNLYNFWNIDSHPSTIDVRQLKYLVWHKVQSLLHFHKISILSFTPSFIAMATTSMATRSHKVSDECSARNRQYP